MEDKESGSAADNNDSTHSTDEGTDQNHNPGEIPANNINPDALLTF